MVEWYNAGSSRRVVSVRIRVSPLKIKIDMSNEEILKFAELTGKLTHIWNPDGYDIMDVIFESVKDEPSEDEKQWLSLYENLTGRL